MEKSFEKKLVYVLKLIGTHQKEVDFIVKHWDDLCADKIVRYTGKHPRILVKLNSRNAVLLPKDRDAIFSKIKEVFSEE